ncbi:MAG: hypothetical protein OXI50_16715 [Gammaproteobacteria bacterium]|nr:hypothetical protein [Gammaproteobacteria bacterium]
MRESHLEDGSAARRIDDRRRCLLTDPNASSTHDSGCVKVDVS